MERPHNLYEIISNIALLQPEKNWKKNIAPDFGLILVLLHGKSGLAAF